MFYFKIFVIDKNITSNAPLPGPCKSNTVNLWKTLWYSCIAELEKRKSCNLTKVWTRKRWEPRCANLARSYSHRRKAAIYMLFPKLKIDLKVILKSLFVFISRPTEYRFIWRETLFCYQCQNTDYIHSDLEL